ncbi:MULTISPECIES: lysis protein [Pantoea]|jgi:prophage endopeptidase|uniref:lysis protein n=1 Tax=Pantoea TaxID=53335 RepID=UPI000EA25CE5|nr:MULTISPECIES: lysis protein [Pantoea]NYB00577.1 lysis protein [Pantoea piersonii]NYB08124.1 lysis protein [Pantoea piersonii]NYB35725.1 lysis protein [Pantoea piersonii]RKJ90188.1 lysis protein [Pantoea piersonii]
MRYLLLCFCLVALGAGLLASHYHDKAMEWRAAAHQTQQLARQQEATLSEMQRRQREVAALDAKYTKELANAQATIEQLHHDVIAGRKRLYLKTRRSAMPEGKTPGTTSVDDAARARPDNSTEQAYFTLRRRIELAGKQIAGLQQYIKEQCLK